MTSPKFTKAELALIEGKYGCDELMPGSRKLYDAIGQYFQEDVKRDAIRSIIKTLMERSSGSECFTKCFYELVYLNDVINKVTKLYRLPKLVVSKSKIHGNGVFAEEDIKKGTIVTIYPVHFIIEDWHKVYVSPEILNTMEDKVPSDIHKYLLTGKEDEVLYKDYQNGHIINHNNRPNTYFQLVNPDNKFMCNVWVIISIKGIKKGEELTVDYGPKFTGLN
jgi:hypothetical protein